MSYNLIDFQGQFPDERACLDYLFNVRFPNGGKCPECNHTKCFHPIAKRREYVCGWCGYHISPCAGTIFHKSETPLVKWFFGIFLFAMSKNGVAAKELERQLGVTYKTAWRMAHEIRRLMTDDGKRPLKGVVEADETYFGGKRAGKRGRGAAGKTPIIGVVERRGEVRVKAVDAVNTANAVKNIRANVEPGATIYTDELGVYNPLAKLGFKHDRVNHGALEYVRGRAHTNTLDGFWSQVKRSIDGTHHHVSRKHLPLYVDEFAFRYNHRYETIWPLLAERLGMQTAAAA